MSVGGTTSCSSSGAPRSLVDLPPAQAYATAQVELLSTSLDMAAQLNAMMLRSLDAGGPAGFGDSVDTYA